MSAGRPNTQLEEPKEEPLDDCPPSPPLFLRLLEQSVTPDSRGRKDRSSHGLRSPVQKKNRPEEKIVKDELDLPLSHLNLDSRNSSNNNSIEPRNLRMRGGRDVEIRIPPASQKKEKKKEKEEKKKERKEKRERKKEKEEEDEEPPTLFAMKLENLKELRKKYEKLESEKIHKEEKVYNLETSFVKAFNDFQDSAIDAGLVKEEDRKEIGRIFSESSSTCFEALTKTPERENGFMDWEEVGGSKERETSKKRRVSSSSPVQSKPVKKEYKDKNELECPKCEYTTRAVSGWEEHLRVEHTTTALKEGIILRCECGHESYTRAHSRKCDIANYTLILKDEKETPKCVSCEKYPSTAQGYAYHLNKCHESSLLKNGIYLKCMCGFKVTSRDTNKKHDKKCAGDEFTLHKIGEE